jgi:hypothetical protein
MKKNFGEIFESIQVDPITGKYFIFLSEQVMNELEWYEDTEIRMIMDGGELILSERD